MRGKTSVRIGLWARCAQVTAEAPGVVAEARARQSGPMTESRYEVQPIGWVESSLVDLDAAPKQGDEGSPDAWLVFRTDVADGVRDLRPGTDVIVLTWLDRARRDVLAVHPRGDA